MPNPDLVAYFQQNVSSYSLEELKAQALQQGYSLVEVDEAVRAVQGGGFSQTAVNTASQYLPMSSKNPAKEGAVAAVIVGVVWSLLYIPVSFLWRGVVFGGLATLASLVFLPVGIVIGALLGAGYGWLIFTFQDKLPGGSLMMKAFIPLLVLDILFLLSGIFTLFLNPLYFLVSKVLAIAASFFFAKLFASRMGV